MRLQSLKSKLLLAVSLLVIGSGLLISLLVTQRYSSSLFQSLSAQAENLAHAVELNATDKILTNDLVALQKMIDYKIRSNPMVAYIFIIRDNQVLAHTFPEGIPAFESLKEFVLLINPEEAPFMWLRVLGEVDLAFVVTIPGIFCPNYEIEISDKDVEFLGLESPDDALVLCIVTVRSEDPAEWTANLTGPIIINSKTAVGKQVVPMNAAAYSVKHNILGELRKTAKEE